MRLGLVGLGRMGGPMAWRLLDVGHDVIGCDVAPSAADRARRAGVDAVGALPALIRALEIPRVIWLMLPAGAITAQVLDQLAELLSPGDLVVDGGNSDWRHAGPRSERLAAGGIRFLDVGVSGGQWGWRHGYGLSVGGALAAPDAVAPVGPVGAGHFVKAVHNGVEYALLQAYAEGYALLCAHQDLDALAAMRVWQAGCVARSFVLEQTVAALADDPALAGVGTAVAETGMGRWTAEEAIRLAVATPVLTAALQARFAGQGRSGLVTRATAMRWMYLGVTAYVAGETVTPAIGDDDLLVCLSASGRSGAILAHAATAGAVGARIVALTATPNSPLAGAADLVVVIPAGTGVASVQHAGSLFEQTCLILGDVLCGVFQQLHAIADRDLDRQHAN